MIFIKFVALLAVANIISLYLMTSYKAGTITGSLGDFLLPLCVAVVMGYVIGKWDTGKG